MPKNLEIKCSVDDLLTLSLSRQEKRKTTELVINVPSYVSQKEWEQTVTKLRTDFKNLESLTFKRENSGIVMDHSGMVKPKLTAPAIIAIPVSVLTGIVSGTAKKGKNTPFLPKLSALKVEQCNMVGSLEQRQQFFENAERFSKLTSLHLEQYPLSDHEISLTTKTISSLLESQEQDHSLKHMSANDSIMAAGFMSLIQRKNTPLTHVGMSYRQATPAIVASLLPALESPQCKLQSLSFLNTPSITKPALEILQQVMTTKPIADVSLPQAVSGVYKENPSKLATPRTRRQTTQPFYAEILAGREEKEPQTESKSALGTLKGLLKRKTKHEQEKSFTEKETPTLEEDVSKYKKQRITSDRGNTPASNTRSQSKLPTERQL